jgi:predicted metal-dependent peptidase
MISGEILPFYGEFNQFVNFIKDNSMPTCGVNVTDDGMNFYWNEEFLDYLPQEQVNFVFIHETFHLLFDHPERSEGYDKNIANLAQDMIINKIINDDIVKTTNYRLKGFVQLPKDKEGKNMAIFPPKEYKGNLIFEELYWWLKKQQEKLEKDLKHFLDNHLKDIMNNIEENKGCTLDKHIEDEVSKEFRKQVVDNVKETLRNRGLITNDIERSLNKLQRQHKDYLKEIKRGVVNQLFGNIKQETITRPNRRGIQGIKGFKRHSQSINCILDTSGSMRNEIEYVLSYIFQNNIEINLIQIDTKVKDFKVIKNMKQLEGIKIRGGGGTILTPAIQYISKNSKLNKNNTVILTDGISDVLNFYGMKGKALILTINQKPTIINSKNRVKTILIKK